MTSGNTRLAVELPIIGIFVEARRFGEYFSRLLLFGNHATHCRFNHCPKRVEFTGDPLSLQPKRRGDLFLCDLCLRLARLNFSLC